MRAIDYRNDTWAGLQERLIGLRLAVWQAWQTHGPGTTREVAARAGMDILTFRPRTTELYQLGLLAVKAEGSRLKAKSSAPHEGVYAARTLDAARADFEREKLLACQPELALG